MWFDGGDSGKPMMLEVSSSETPRPASPRSPEAPEMMQAFISRHVSFFILVSVLLAQLILLAFQVTRKHHVRLINVWAVSAFDPFERSVSGLGDAASAAWHSYPDLWQAQRQNKELQGELAEARAEVLQLSVEDRENTQLRSLLDLQRRLPLRSIGATVIAASPGAPLTIFIDKGSAEGFAADMPVITPEGIVGKTIAVFHHTSQVLLVTSPDSGAGCMLAKSGAQGVLKGDGNGLCYLDYIMNSEKVEPGDIVSTSGLDQIYPKGLLAGTVVKVSDGDIYKHIVVKPAAALDRLDDVLVVVQPSVKQN
ncbi:MAG: rod shape-determining protein MreC [Terriglobia bacterium]